MTNPTTRQVVDKVLERLRAKEDWYDQFSDDCTYVIPGETQLSGVWNGPDECRAGAMKILQTCFKSLPTFTIKDILVEGERAVILATSEAEGTYGPYRQRYAFYLIIRDGKIVHWDEGQDSLPVEIALLGSTLTRRTLP